MRIKQIHDWDLSYREAVELQKELAGKLQIAPFSKEIHYAVGVDISCNFHSNYLFSAAVVWDAQKGEVIETETADGETTFPYIPGLLSFREAPLIIKALEKLDTVPDVILVDGHGIAHPRGFGIASHIGILIEIPTIGVAKKKLAGEYDMPGLDKFSVTDIILDEKPIGAVLRLRRSVKPIFISPGNRIDIDSSVGVVKRTITRFRLPEPIRFAHQACNNARKSVS